MKTILLIILSFIATTNIIGQNISKEYIILRDKADSLYYAQKYEDAAFTYIKAFNLDGVAYANDRYNAACAFALSNHADSTFSQLNIIATRASYSYYSHLATDIDLIPLHKDNRWRPLLDKVKENKAAADAKWSLSCGGNSEIIGNPSAARMEKQNLDVDIDVKNKRVHVKGYVEVDFKDENSIEVILFKNIRINNITDSNNQHLRYVFDIISKYPIVYIPDGRMLTIYRQSGSKDKQSIYFDYVCDLKDIGGWGRSFNEDWIEIGYYTAWYPVQINNRDNLQSALTVSIDEPYVINGSGIVTQKGNKWHITHDWDIFDNVIIASKDLKSKSMEINGTDIEIAYTTFPESDTDSVFAAFDDVLRFYEQLYGKQGSSYMKFVLCPTKGGGGYSRKNYISLKTSKYSPSLKKGVAHELAHFWWNKANTNIWEDWMNEAFAEYSMLLYIRKDRGHEAFDTYIDAYKVNSSHSCPIWGIDRAKPEAYTALYEKGALILYEFHKKIGAKRFFSFAKKALSREIITTEAFLQLIETEFGLETKNWFEMCLKAKNDEMICI